MIRSALVGISVAAIVAVGVAGCGNSGGGSGGTVAYKNNGNADAGKTLFTGAGGCAACHTIDGVSNGAIGPNLTHVGARLSADQILTQIANPQQRPAPYSTPPGSTPMPKNSLSDQQRADLTAYLSSLK